MAANHQSSTDYDFNHAKRGTAVIFWNWNFEKKLKLPRIPRKVLKKDISLLKTALIRIGFKQKVDIKDYQNQKVEQMLKIMEDHANRDYSDSDCFLCIILSHGRFDKIKLSRDTYQFHLTDAIYGTDELVSLESLMEPIVLSKTLIGKPKIFIVNACRGLKTDRGVSIETVHPPVPGPNEGIRDDTLVPGPIEGTRDDAPVPGPSEGTRDYAPVPGPSEGTTDDAPVPGPSEGTRDDAPVSGPIEGTRNDAPVPGPIEGTRDDAPVPGKKEGIRDDTLVPGTSEGTGNDAPVSGPIEGVRDDAPVPGPSKGTRNDAPVLGSSEGTRDDAPVPGKREGIRDDTLVPGPSEGTGNDAPVSGPIEGVRDDARVPGPSKSTRNDAPVLGSSEGTRDDAPVPATNEGFDDASVAGVSEGIGSDASVPGTSDGTSGDLSVTEANKDGVVPNDGKGSGDACQEANAPYSGTNEDSDDSAVPSDSGGSSDASVPSDGGGSGDTSVSSDGGGSGDASVSSDEDEMKDEESAVLGRPVLHAGIFVNSLLPEYIPVWKDHLLVYATQPGFPAYRSKTESIFIKAFCKQITNLEEGTVDFLKLLTHVNHDVAFNYETGSKDQLKKQMPWIACRLTKKIIFCKKN